MIKNYLKSLNNVIIIFVLTSSLFPMSLTGQIVEWEDCQKFLGSVSSGTTPANWLTYWNQVSPENAGKWGSVEGTRDQMNWGNLDLAYNLAKDNGIPFKHHVFVWGNQQPNWIESLSEEEQLEEIEEWIMSYCERYPETDFIEVVNEPLNDPPFGNGDGNYANALGGLGTTGSDWIIKAFELAKEYCPNAQLMINEYNILNNSNNSISRYLDILDLLIERDLIDAVGVQGHAFTVNYMSSQDIDAALDQIAEKGLPIYVTELDIDTRDQSDQNELTGTQSELDDVQLERYKEIFPALWNHPAVNGITLWGYIQNQMWRTTGYLVNGTTTSATERPAMTWLKNFITKSNAKCGPITSIESEIKSSKFTIYPNPASENLITVESKILIDRVLIRDMGGKIVHTIEPKHSFNSLDLEINLHAGVYIVEISNKDALEVQRLVVN